MRGYADIFNAFEGDFMRELSSPLSFFYKFVFLFLWFGGFGYGVRNVIFSGIYDTRWLQYSGVWLVVSVFIFFTTGSIKKVAIDGDFLWVSNFIKADKIPLSDISAVDGSTFLSPRLVWFTLKEKSIFGKRITFLPKHRMSSGFGKHPIVHELIDELKL